MSNQDFSISFLVDQSPMEVYNAVNNVRGWWSEALEGDSENVNGVFTYRHGDIHYSKHKVIDLIPGERTVWRVLDAKLTFVADQAEWIGTTNIFEIEEQEGKTKLTFTHQGLTPQVQCFEGCSRGWTHYLQNSLLPLITTGKGMPDRK